MTSIEVVDVSAVALAAMDLDELAVCARRELANAEAMAAGAIGHLRQCGLVLAEARKQCPNGEWRQWCEAVGISTSHASRLVRLAWYWDAIPAEAKAPYVDAQGALRNGSIQKALRSISGLPRTIPSTDSPIQYSKELRSLSAELRADGASWGEISIALGVPASTIRDWCEPNRKKIMNTRRLARLKEQAAARTALREQRKREERDALAKATNNSDLAKAYSLVRQLAVILDRTNDEAYGYITRAEAAIVRELRAERTQP